MVFVIHWHESAMDLHVFPILIPPPTSLSTRSLWVFLVHQAWALVSCMQPGLAIHFTIDNIHVLSYIDMNQPWIYMCSPSRYPLPLHLYLISLGLPVHQAWALVSCIQPGLAIHFTIDNIHVLMLFSQNIPPLSSPTESKSLFCTSVSLFLFCI